MQEELLKVLRELPQDQLQEILVLAQKELGNRAVPSCTTEEDCHCSCCSAKDNKMPLLTPVETEPKEIPDNVLEELRDMRLSATAESEVVTITCSVSLDVEIECNDDTGDPEEDMELNFEVRDWPDDDDVLRGYKEVREVYNAMHKKVLDYRQRIKEVAEQYGWDEEELIRET